MKYMSVLVIFLLCVTGCALPNQRLWYKANIKADGLTKRKGNAIYHGIRIGTDEIPYDGRPTFAIRLPSGGVLSSDDFSEPKIRPIALALLKTGDSRITHDQSCGKSHYFIEGVTFTYKQNQLVSIYISRLSASGKKYITQIAKTTNETFWPLPISEENLTKIFGLPDKTNEYFAW